MIYCLSVHGDTILWNRAIDPDVDRLAIHPEGQLPYVPTWENGWADYINVECRHRRCHSKGPFSSQSHDTLFPLSGPIFQETKAIDGSGHYLYLINPSSYTVSSIGPYFGILEPYSADSMSNYAVSNVTNLWGMQVANIKTGQIVTAKIADHQAKLGCYMESAGLLTRVRFGKAVLRMIHMYTSGTRRIQSPGALADVYAYVAPNKNTVVGTEIFDARTHASVGVIGSSEDLVEIDFVDGKIGQVGDQYGIGRATR
jgi:hypothetical protein